MKRLFVASLVFAALPAAASYEANGVALGASEAAVRKSFPSAHCKPLEWASAAAERRCDDAKSNFAGVEVRVTFYLRKDSVQAFDLRFETRDLDKVTAYAKSRYGKPVSEGKETIERRGRPPREIFKARWEKGQDRAVLTAQMEKKRSALSASRGDFEEEIYRVR